MIVAFFCGVFIIARTLLEIRDIVSTIKPQVTKVETWKFEKGIGWVEFHLDTIDISKIEAKEPEKKINPSYKSKDGFIEVDVKRGLFEIEHLLDTLSEYNAFICGGYVRYMASPNTNPVPAGDVDVYCIDPDTFSDLKERFQKDGLKIRHENPMAITYRRCKGDHIYSACPTIQLIKPIKEGKIVAFGSMKEVIENFDFTIIRIGLDPNDKYQALADADFIHDEKNLILRLKNIHCPVSSTLRCMKYAKKRYWLPAFQTLRLFLDWDQRSDEYREKLFEFFNKFEGDGLTQEEINELEALMRID